MVLQVSQKKMIGLVVVTLSAGLLSACGSSSTTEVATRTCQGLYNGTIDPPAYEVRVANRDRQLAEGGPLGGGVDGGIYLEGSFAFQTDANCKVIRDGSFVFGFPLDLNGTVKSDFTFNMFSNNAGPFVGKVDANNVVSGQQQEAGKEWVHGVLNGKFHYLATF